MPTERVRTAGLTDEQIVALREKWKPAEHALVFSGVLAAIVGAVVVLLGLTSLMVPDIGRGIALCMSTSGVAMVLGGRWSWHLDKRSRPAMVVAIVAWEMAVWMLGVIKPIHFAPVVLAAVPWIPGFGFVMSEEYRHVVLPIAVVREPMRFR